jgi:hypothetical protein
MAHQVSFEPKEDGKKVNIMDYLKIDASTISLAAANILTMILALTGGWSLIVILWVYWIQSVIIGVFNFFRLLTLKNYDTKDFMMDGKPLVSSSESNYAAAIFFAIHYGIFHLVYLIFLSIASFLRQDEVFRLPALWFIIASAAIFVLNHAFSFISRFAKDRKKKQNLGAVMFFPYARIIPMHLCIVFGLAFDSSGAGIFIFMVLKTLADIVMHQIEHATDAR